MRLLVFLITQSALKWRWPLSRWVRRYWNVTTPTHAIAKGRTLSIRWTLRVAFLIDRSREIHTALMNPKQRTGPEEDVYRFARASVVADADLAAGHVITESDIWARRPGSGEIAGFEFDKVVGKTLKVAVTRNQQLKWSDFEN